METNIKQFYDSFLITDQLLSENAFQMHIVSSLEQAISNAPNKITQMLSLIRHMNHGNRITTSYGTDVEYLDLHGLTVMVRVSAHGKIYDNACNCETSYNCTTDAKFAEPNSSNTVSVNGMKMGCTPSESFRRSTLECFYNLSCIKLIEEYTNSTNGVHSTTSSISILLANTTRFAVNASVAELTDELFVENWNRTTNYSSYYEQCAPAHCSYSYTQEIMSLYTLTLLVGLQGGMTIVLKWIAPLLVRSAVNVYRYRKKRRNVVQPSASVRAASETGRRIDHSSTCDTEVPPMYVFLI